MRGPSVLGRLGRVLRAITRRARFEREMTEEVRFHLSAQADELERRGLPRAEAERQARLAFGNVENLKEECRRSRGLALWDELRGDLRFGVRNLARSPGYTVVALVTLGLGVGANTTIFSVVDGVLLRPLPFPESERLVRVAVYPNGAFQLYLEETSSYASLGAYSSEGELNLLADALPERVRGRSVSAGFFGVLGVEAQLGRTFAVGENRPGAAAVVLISDGIWRRRFGADPGVLGQSIVVDGVPRTVVGVMPRGFAFPLAGTDLWIPLLFDRDAPVALWNSASTFVGRLRPGVDVGAADAEHRALVPRVRDGFPWPMPNDYGTGPENHVQPIVEVMTARVRGRLLLLLGAVGLVLLVACANVANLNLTRTTARGREIAVRLALGGGRLRIARQLLVEQLLLACAGGLAALAVAAVATPLLLRWLPDDTPRLDQVSLDGRVLAFTAATAVLAGMLAAVGPALTVPSAGPLGASGPGQGTRSTSRGPGGRRLAAALVVAEIAVSAALVIGAGLLLRSLAALLAVEPGVQTERLVSARVTLDRAGCTARQVAPGSTEWELPSGCRPFFRALEDRLRAMPGVTRFALASKLPLLERGAGMAMDVEDHPRPRSEPAHWLEQHAVTPEYFSVLGLPIELGRPLSAADRAGSEPVVVASRALVDRYWPHESPLGKRIKPVWLEQWATIVGVVPDVAMPGSGEEPGLAYYSPLAQEPHEQVYVLAETDVGLAAFETALRALLREVDPGVPVSRVLAMPEVRAASLASPRTTSMLLSAAALLALVLGAVGVYGVLSYGVAQRRREIGVRMAMGADAHAVRRMVLADACRLMAAGLAIGLLAAWIGAAVLRDFVYGVSVRDPLTFVGVALLFVPVGLAAAYAPARRATRVPTTEVLRQT